MPEPEIVIWTDKTYYVKDENVSVYVKFLDSWPPGDSVNIRVENEIGELISNAVIDIPNFGERGAKWDVPGNKFPAKGDHLFVAYGNYKNTHVKKRFAHY